MEVLVSRSANLPMAPPKTTKKSKPDPKPKPEEKPANPDRIDDKWRPPPIITEPGPSPERYSIGRKLGKGGFAVCFEGTSDRSSQVFALKVVKAKVEQRKMMEKFRTELQIHAKMHHPNIVEFLRAFTIDDHTYVVLQMCPNGNLTEMVKARSCLTLPEVRRFMIQICGGVKYMHKRSVIHRDLKMGNIFLDANMNLKIGDFGLAAVMADEQDRRTTLCGTPNYIAPEILSKSSNRGHDNKVDTWAIGVICYAMLMGTPPFQSKTQQEIYSKLRTLEYEWKMGSKNYIPQQAKDFVASCLNLNSAERPEMDELVEHAFFTMGVIANELDPSCLKSSPPWIENADPRGDRVKTGYGVSHGRICRECGVGMGLDGRPRAGVGAAVSISALVEIEAENREGCAPVIPLPAGVLYKQFADAQLEWKGRQKYPLQAPQVRSRKPVGGGGSSSSSAEVSTNASVAPPVQGARDVGAPSEVRPVIAGTRPYQSFAAQQRQQALPAGLIRRVDRGDANCCISKDAQIGGVPALALLKERPLRASSTRATRSTVGQEPVGQELKPLLRTASIVKGVENLAFKAEGEGDGPFHRKVGASMIAARPKTQRSPSDLVLDKAALRPASCTSVVSSGSDEIVPPVLQPTAGNRRPTVQDIATRPQTGPHKSQTQRSRSPPPRATEAPLPQHLPFVIALADRAVNVPASTRADVLESLQALHKALDPRRAVGSSRELRSARSTGSHRPTTTYPRVDKWVDYATRHGIAYILTDGTVGMILKSSDDNTRPSSCVVVRNASTHTMRRAKSLEYQFVPQGPGAQDIEFYEQADYEREMKRLDIPAQAFLLDLDAHPSQVAAASTIQAGLEGSECERMKGVALLDKFGKYMNKQTGGWDSAHGGGDVPTSSCFVHFYQRVGNVGVWRFADGGLQFNFPDHTKLTVHRSASDKAASPYVVDGVYLVPTDAVALSRYGIATGEAMERRGEFSHPLDQIMADQLRRSEAEIMRTNEVKEKLCWIRAVVGCWLREGGLGKMGEERLGWSGLQERRDDKKIKLQWVTVGRYGGDGDGSGAPEQKRRG